MALLTIHSLTHYYGANLIFRDVSLHVTRGEKVALVGINGAGKSTLLNIIAGNVVPDAGQVTVERGNRVAYLTQEARFTTERTLWQQMEAACVHVTALQQHMVELEQHLANTNDPAWETHMAHYGDIAHRFECAGGYHMQQRIESTLHHLGFTEAHHTQIVTHLSGGQKTRAALAATLLSDPDLLLLDEPTNHLDLHALDWLETFLRSWQGTLIVTSHDRYFLDAVTSRTLDMTHGTLDDYPAAYSKFVALKAERLERTLKEYQAQQAYIARTEEFVRRYKAGQRAKEAKGRETRLNRYKAQQAINRPQHNDTLRLAINTDTRSGDMVLQLHTLRVGYGNTALVTTPDVELRRGEKIAIIGANGSGKTTLLRTLMGDISPLSGTYLLGHNVTVGYFAQGHESLVMHATVLQEILRINPALGEEKARSVLGQFLFYGDDVFKVVSSLSGGERNRVALAQLTLQAPNLLIMDEPTNHLDITAREALETVLQSFVGSILFVSHDRYFIDAIADMLWVVEEKKITPFYGSYRDFQQYHAQKQGVATKQQRKHKERKSAERRQATHEQRERTKRMAHLEAEVAQLEQDIATVQAALQAASSLQDVAEVASLGKHYAELEQRLEERFDAWSSLAEAIEIEAENDDATPSSPQL